MATFAQIVNGQALNVLTGDDLESALAEHFVPGYDGGHPGIDWVEIEDGAVSGSAIVDGKVVAPIIEAAPEKPAMVKLQEISQADLQILQSAIVILQKVLAV